ncbi:MAG: AP2/ERF family transcription factor [Pirellulaceae bacterium]
MAKKDPNRNLSRIQITSARGSKFSGWEVRIQRRGKSMHKFFNDKKFGGEQGAHKAAVEFRDSIESKFKKFSVSERARNPSSRNTSGHVGVRKHSQVDVRGEYEYHYEYWIAQWTDKDGKRKTKAFSVSEHGDEKAFKLAVQARKEGVKESGR